MISSKVNSNIKYVASSFLLLLVRHLLLLAMHLLLLAMHLLLLAMHFMLGPTPQKKGWGVVERSRH